MEGKSRIVAILLTFFLALLGFHKFYLNRNTAGILYLIGSLVVIGLVVTIPLVVIDLIVALDDARREVPRAVRVT